MERRGVMAFSRALLIAASHVCPRSNSINDQEETWWAWQAKACASTVITELPDLRVCTALRFLNVSHTALTQLDVSANPTLVRLDCSSCDHLAALNVHGCKALLELHIPQCGRLHELDLSTFTAFQRQSYATSTVLSLVACGALAISRVEVVGASLDVSACPTLPFVDVHTRGGCGLWTSAPARAWSP